MTDEIRKQAEEAARKTLVDFNGGGLRFIPPIDPVTIAAQHDILCKVAPSNVMEKKFALITQTGQTYIIVDETLSYIEQRVLVARTLGESIYQSLSLEDDTTKQDVWSRYFAQELLMPQSAIIPLYARGKYVREIATIFYVTDAMVEERFAQLV